MRSYADSQVRSRRRSSSMLRLTSNMRSELVQRKRPFSIRRNTLLQRQAGAGPPRTAKTDVVSPQRCARIAGWPPQASGGRHDNGER